MVKTHLQERANTPTGTHQPEDESAKYFAALGTTVTNLWRPSFRTTTENIRMMHCMDCEGALYTSCTFETGMTFSQRI
jgi:hypothetical protein